MKPRRVIVTIELETAAPLSVLREKDGWVCDDAEVIQVQANVIRQPKPKRRAKR